MSWKAITIILVLLILSSSIISLESGESPRIIIYGSHRCPACSGLKKFFESTGLPYEFREIYDCQLSGCKVSEYGTDLVKILKIADLEPYIPVSVVVNSNGYVVAIVQGMIEDREFWDKLISKKIWCGIEVYSDGKVDEISDPENISKVIKIVTNKDISPSTIKSIIETCTATTTTTTTATTSSSISSGEENGVDWQLIILGITFAIIVVSIIMVSILRKGRGRH